MRTIVLVALAVFLALPAQAKKKEEVDYLALAAVMIRDQHFDRAEQALTQVDLQDDDTDVGRYYVLRGLVRLHLGLYQQSAEDFSQAIENGQAEPIVRIHLAQALFGATDYRGALDAFARAETKAAEIPGAFAMRAQAHWELEERPEAWAMLDAGIARHPTYGELLRRKVFFAMELGLLRTAVDLGRTYLASTAGTFEDDLAIGWSLVESGNLAEGLGFLEIAHLKHPRERKVTLALARAYQKRGMPRTAAQLLEALAITGDAQLAIEASELYRAAGLPWRALALNGRIADSKARLRQRLAIMLDLRRYDMIATMERDLLRVGLMSDDSVRYAVAFAWFEEGDYERTERLLGGLRDPELFQKAAEIRKAMQECRDERWKC